MANSGRGLIVCWWLLSGAAAFTTPRASFLGSARVVHPLKASIVDSSSDHDDSDQWYELEQVAHSFQEESGRIMFHQKELALRDPQLAAQLDANFDIPSTWEQAITQFSSQPQVIVLSTAFLTSLSFRLSLGGLGLGDLIAVLLTKLAWEVQEWAYHSRNFHGNSGRTHFPFGYHDQHHDLPYYHVAMEPTLVCFGYALSITSLATAVTSLLGPSSLAIASTTHAAFLLYSIQYLLVHYLAHAKVPLKGWLQSARAHHIQHHLNHEINLNMASHTVDQLMKTDKRQR